MMNKLLVALLLVVLLFSCKEDDEYKTTYSAWGIAGLSANDPLGYKIMLDDSVVLLPTGSLSSYMPQDSDRVNVFFELADGASIEDDPIEVVVVNFVHASIDDILVVSDTLILDTLANDPIGIYNNSIRQVGNLWDVIFNIDYSGYKYHTVDLVYFPDSLASMPDGVYLELRHNGNGDFSTTPMQFLHCFNMESIVPFQHVEDSVPFTLVVNSGAYLGAKSKIDGYYYKPGLEK